MSSQRPALPTHVGGQGLCYSRAVLMRTWASGVAEGADEGDPVLGT